MKRYVLEAVFDDPDFGVVGTERRFRSKWQASKAWSLAEERRSRNGAENWHYQIRDIRTNTVLYPN